MITVKWSFRGRKNDFFFKFFSWKLVFWWNEYGSRNFIIFKVLRSLFLNQGLFYQSFKSETKRINSIQISIKQYQKKTINDNRLFILFGHKSRNNNACFMCSRKLKFHQELQFSSRRMILKWSSDGEISLSKSRESWLLRASSIKVSFYSVKKKWSTKFSAK